MADSTRIMEEELKLLQTFTQTPSGPLEGRQTTDLPFELRFKIYHLALADYLKLGNMNSNSIHVRPTVLDFPSDVYPSFSTCPLDWARTFETRPEHQIREPAISHAARSIRAEVLALLYKPDIPISYTFHACPASLIRNILHRIHNDDIPLGIHLETLTFCLPKAIDDQGLAILWLMSLAISLSWCLHNYTIQPEIIVTEPEIRIRQAYIAVDELETPQLSISKASIPIKPVDGVRSRPSTTATELITSFLAFTTCLPALEIIHEDQVIFALADFLDVNEDKCRSCILWRGMWRASLIRIYGSEVARTMVKDRKFEPILEGLEGVVSHGSQEERGV